MSVIPGKIVLHRMGYYTDQAGIMRRYSAEEPSWAAHIEKSRELILRTIDLINPPAITVLGSGWLLDLPLEEMLENGRRINLSDILLPHQVENRIKTLSNVTFIKEDITGGLITGVYDNARRGLLKHPADITKILSYKPYEPHADAGLIISLNLLSQLDSLPADYLRKKTLISEEKIMEMRQKVQQQHVDMLRGRDSLLITDFYEHLPGSYNEAEKKSTLAIDLPDGFLREEWDWIFDTGRNYNPAATTVFRVAGIVFRR